MQYDPFRLMTDPARRTSLPRLAMGLGLAVALTVGIGQGLLALAEQVLSAQTHAALIGQMRRGDTALGMYALLFSTGAMGMAALITARLVHGRRGRSLLGPLPLALRQFGRAALALLLIQVLLMGLLMLWPPWPMAAQMLPAMALDRWALLLPLTLLALLVQTGSEELLFRGYLQSQLAARLSRPWVWLLLPSALFGLGHWAPGIYGGNAGLVTLWAVLFGLAAADLTARTGTLGPALALHLMNNLVAVAVAAPNGPMTGLALYILPIDIEDEAMLRAFLPVDLLGIGVGWLAVRLALRV
ncbi:CPBP family intramembrane metalloprotease [Salipiger sp. 1_MG-2023]|nr:CPBP family intramembrane metalloprotease [Salipiger sp. 1_MG-2023]